MTSSPRSGKALGSELQHLVRANAADDPVGIEAVDLANRSPQPGVIGIRIAVHLMRSTGYRLARLVRGAVGVFVRGQLDHLIAPFDLCRTTDVKRDLHDAGLRLDTGLIGHGCLLLACDT